MKKKQIMPRYLNTILQNGDYYNQTLKDFLQEVNIPYNTSLKKINKALKECGIMPIKEN